MFPPTPEGRSDSRWESLIHSSSAARPRPGRARGPHGPTGASSSLLCGPLAGRGSLTSEPGCSSRSQHPTQGCWGIFIVSTRAHEVEFVEVSRVIANARNRAYAGTWGEGRHQAASTRPQVPLPSADLGRGTPRCQRGPTISGATTGRSIRPRPWTSSTTVAGGRDGSRPGEGRTASGEGSRDGQRTGG